MTKYVQPELFSWITNAILTSILEGVSQFNGSQNYYTASMPEYVEIEHQGFKYKIAVTSRGQS